MRLFESTMIATHRDSANCLFISQCEVSRHDSSAASDPMSKQQEDDDKYRFSSPACLIHELDDPLSPSADGGVARELPDWAAVKQWRRATRTELLARRGSLDPRARRVRGERAKDRLLAEFDPSGYAVLGVYWPIRGEIDVLDVARRHIAAGGIAAVPVVTRKNAPVEFWRWQPGMKMQRGFWGIPVPATREAVRPDALLIPLVGFDAAGFRLGYGGGYYDRTRAAPAARRHRLRRIRAAHDPPAAARCADEPNRHRRARVSVRRSGVRCPGVRCPGV